MINITIARDGKASGLTMLAESPHKFSSFNPYNTFFKYTEDDVDELRMMWKEACEMYGDNYKTYNVPEHLILMMLMMLYGKGAYNEVSFPEAGVLPAVQSIFLCFVVVLHNKVLKSKCVDIKINTLSEYMVRMSQLLFARGVITNEDIKIFDQDNDGSELTSEEINKILKGCHDYETGIGAFVFK